MAKDVLAIPEEQLRAVVSIIRLGLSFGSTEKTIIAWQALYKWCNEMDEYLERFDDDN